MRRCYPGRPIFHARNFAAPRGSFDIRMKELLVGAGAKSEWCSEQNNFDGDQLGHSVIMTIVLIRDIS